MDLLAKKFDLDILFVKKYFDAAINAFNNEVSDIRFIMVNGMDFYKWAFNHKELIKGIYDNINIRHWFIQVQY